MLVGLALLFIANIAFVVTGRTALLVAPVLTLLLGWRRQAGKACCAPASWLRARRRGWLSSPYLRVRLVSFEKFQAYRDRDAMNSTGLHLEFSEEIPMIIATAPFIGHGTGSIPEQFRRVTVSGTGAASVATVNPHNQVFAVAIQLGLVGGVAAGDVGRALLAVPRRRSRRVVRRADGRPERDVVVVQLAPVRFRTWLALCLRRRRARRHGVAAACGAGAGAAQ